MYLKKKLQTVPFSENIPPVSLTCNIKWIKTITKERGKE